MKIVVFVKRGALHFASVRGIKTPLLAGAIEWRTLSIKLPKPIYEALRSIQARVEKFIKARRKKIN